MKRRDFLKQLYSWSLSAIATCFVAFPLIALIKQKSLPKLLIPPVLRPPGAINEKDFLATCIRCNRCKDICPAGCIQLASSSDFVVLDTPHIIPYKAGCTLCMKCTKICPSGALRPLSKSKDVKMGTAVVDKRLCVSHNGTGRCGACHTICPFKNKALVQGMHNAPTVVKKECVGCGQCEEVCIVDGIKAIRIFSARGDLL